MKDIGEYATKGLKLAGRGIVYVGRELVETLRYFPALSRAMRGDVVGAQEELEEASRPKQITGNYQN